MVGARETSEGEVAVDALRCAGEGEAMVDAGGEFGLVVGDHHQGLSW